MKTLPKIASVLFCLCSFTLVLHAQVPQLITYQGRVVVGAINFDGSGSFKFALVNAAGTTAYWTNDGTHLDGTEPTAAVALTVTKGLYSVLLGDTSLTNMTAVPAGVFNNSDVRLRVWFNDGTHGSQRLTPDQRVAAVGYAAIAANVPDGAITSAKIANGAVGSTQLAANAVQSANIANGAIGTLQLGINAVTAANIAPGTITPTQLAKPPQSGSINSSSLVIDFDRATFNVVFNPAFISTPNVSLAVETSSPDLAASAVASLATKSSTGFSAVFNSHTRAQITPDATANIGQYVSMAIVNGLPAMAYYDSTNGRPRYIHATDLNGALAWSPPASAVSAAETVAGLSLAAVGFGWPAIAYQRPGSNSLFFIHATDVNGTSWSNTNRVNVASMSTANISLVMVNGNPAIAFNANGPVTYMRSSDLVGGAWGSGTTLDANTTSADDSSLAIVNGNPAVSYRIGSPALDLNYIRASDVNGAAWGAPVNVDTAGNVGTANSLAVVNGNPAISYVDIANNSLKYVRANDASGTTWGAPVTVDTSVSPVRTSLRVINGVPAISYCDSTHQTLKYVRAIDASGAAWSNPVTLDFVGSDPGVTTNLAAVNGNAAMAYYDAVRQTVKYIRAPDLTFKINWIALEP